MWSSEAITSKPLQCAPGRLQAMILAMQQYNAKTKYKKGSRSYLSGYTADISSINHRARLRGKIRPGENKTKILQIIGEKEMNETLQKLKKVLLSCWPDNIWSFMAGNIVNTVTVIITVISGTWILCHTRETTVMNRLQPHFARYGIPNQLLRDNGPQFCCCGM